jgi:STE24 endopeptidase
MKRPMHPLIDQDRQKLAKKYRRANLKIGIPEQAVSACFLFVLLFFNASRNLVARLAVLVSSRFVQTLLYFAIFYTAYTILSFSFSYLSEYVIERKYGFSTQSFASWLTDYIKSLLVGLLLGVLVFETVYIVTYHAPLLWWLWLSLIMILFSVILANLFPVVLLPLFYKTTAVENESLKERITTLCGQASVNLKGIYSINLSSKSTKANAAVVGLGNTKRILIGDTLMQKYTEDEVVATVAHEIIHYKESHIWWLILWQALISISMFFVFSRIYPFIYRWAGFNHVSQIAAFPLFAIIFVVLLAAVKPLGSAISRYYERRGDLGALVLTKNADAFISLMAKFCNEQLIIAYPNPLVEWYKYSHPSPGRRIEFAENWEKPESDIDHFNNTIFSTLQ